MTETAEQFFARHGWEMHADWVPSTQDHDKVVEVVGIFKSEKLSDGQVHGFSLHPLVPSPYPEIWEHWVKLAEAGWARYREDNDL